MARRTGLVTAIFIAGRLCRFLTQYRQSISDETDNPELAIGLIDAALVACSALSDYLSDFRSFGA